MTGASRARPDDRSRTLCATVTGPCLSHGALSIIFKIKHNRRSTALNIGKHFFYLLWFYWNKILAKFFWQCFTHFFTLPYFRSMVCRYWHEYWRRWNIRWNIRDTWTVNLSKFCRSCYVFQRRWNNICTRWRCISQLRTFCSFFWRDLTIELLSSDENTIKFEGCVLDVNQTQDTSRLAQYSVTVCTQVYKKLVHDRVCRAWCLQFNLNHNGQLTSQTHF